MNAGELYPIALIPNWFKVIALEELSYLAIIVLN
jgi:hypothetical protein